jgi:membrane associated rhomboid family serine protease
MIPLRDVIPSRTVPVVTIGLIAANALVFLFQLSLPDRSLRALFYTYGLVPAAFAWPTLFTSMFLHAGWLHIIANMWFLWIFGDNVEDRMGHGRYLVFYLLCGVAAALGQSVIDPESSKPMVGASGAIAGVMGAYFVLYPRSRILTLLPIFFFIQIVEVPAVVFLGLWFAFQLFSGVGSVAAHSQVGGVAVWAHVAGFVFGLIGVFLFRRPERARVEWWHQD